MKQKKMMILLIIIVSQLINFSNSCGLLQTKRTCQCTATYIVNNNITRFKLFELPNIEYCESYLGCNNNKCKKECLNQIKLLLGNNENYVNTQAKNKICELISPDNKPKNKIFVWATWKYTGCSSGDEPIVQDLCCNNKCKCSLSSQIVSKNLNESFQRIIKDFTLDLPIKSKSFECSAPLLDECQAECLSLVSYYFNEPKIQFINNRLNLNIFFNQFIANKMCLDLNMIINKPGVDIFVRVDTSENNGLINHVALGRVCCQMKCKCEYIIREAFNGSLIEKNNNNYNEFLLDTSKQLNFGYECSDELSNCMSACRRKGIEISYLLNYDLDEKQTTLDLDILKINRKLIGDF
jgi:hypothetical protein